MGVQSPGLGKSLAPAVMTLKGQTQLEPNINVSTMCLFTEEKVKQKDEGLSDVRWGGGGGVLGNHLVQCFSKTLVL